MMFIEKLKAWSQYLLPQITITQLVGALASSCKPRLTQWAIKRFIKHFNVNMQEALIEDTSKYQSFNQFFIRELKPSLRPIDDTMHNICSPVDGTISALGKVSQHQLIQAKGHNYSLNSLLGHDHMLSETYTDASYITLYLSPRDYHRVHCPIDAEVSFMTFIPGKLFSVAPFTTRHIEQIFTKNERLIIGLETALGPMVLIMVGAMIVSGINTTWHGDIRREKEPHRWRYPNAKTSSIALKKGQELGHFKMGSTVIMLFPKDSIRFDQNCAIDNTMKMGQTMAQIVLPQG